MMRLKIRLLRLLRAAAPPVRRRPSIWYAGAYSKPVSRNIDLPAEILPYLTVSLHAKVAGYVERVLVDRGSVVKQGELLAELSAPELKAQIAEAESKVQVGRIRKAAGRSATGRGAQSTYDRSAQGRRNAGRGRRQRIDPGTETGGSRAGPGARARTGRASAASAALTLAEGHGSLSEDHRALRWRRDRPPRPSGRAGRPGRRSRAAGDSADLTAAAGGAGARRRRRRDWRAARPFPFRVPAYPDRAYTGTVARIAHALDPKTRTMPVELDVTNRDGSLAPGMYPTVKWPVRRDHPGAVRAQDQRGHYQRAHLRDPRTQRPCRVGGREEGRRRRRSGRSERRACPQATKWSGAVPMNYATARR